MNAESALCLVELHFHLSLRYQDGYPARPKSKIQSKLASGFDSVFDLKIFLEYSRVDIAPP